MYSFTVGPSDSGISANCLFDRDGVLTGTLTMESDLDIGAALQQLGFSLPGDVSDVLVISNPGVLVVSARAEELGVSPGEGAGVGGAGVSRHGARRGQGRAACGMRGLQGRVWGAEIWGGTARAGKMGVSPGEGARGVGMGGGDMHAGAVRVWVRGMW